MTKRVADTSSQLHSNAHPDFKDDLDKLISRIPSMSDMEISAAKEQLLRKIELAIASRSS